MGEGAGQAKGDRARGRRVVLLIGAVVLMSLADLVLTLTYLTSGGMVEKNPLARAVILYNHPGLLVAWKLGTVGLAAAILYVLRHRRAGETGAWVCAGILACLSVHWVRYTEHAETLTPRELATLATMSEHWVAIGDGE